ncbi:hypothetical protein F511_11289 [Dorcoceras hygrometricum]|uniref:Uncharacterized protein n=1 Tax=Dorcoceras hygrometricum TaxID=472368 RepID=A0A2Z7CHQ0_9LAMI|nr:hypothetical protein F511_11289 [Dorcoceras hygrometricum]
MVDELAVVKSQLAVIVEDLKESGDAKKGEGGSSSRPRKGPSGRGLTGGRGGSSSQGEKEPVKEIIQTKVSRTGQDLSRSMEKSARSVESLKPVQAKPDMQGYDNILKTAQTYQKG